MAAVVIACALGLVALAGLTGRESAAPAWASTVVAGLPLVALSGAGLATSGWNLAWGVGMVAAVVAGMLASTIGPALITPGGRSAVATGWWALTWAVVAATLAGAVVRWLAVVAAPLANLSPRALAAVLVVAAAAAAGGGRARRGLARTGAVLVIVLAALILVGGAVAGAPALLGDPLLPVSQSVWAVPWLVAVVVLGALNPALRQIRADGGSVLPGTLLLGAAMAAGLVALLAFTGGSLALPAFSLALVAGYVSFAPSAVGLLLALPVALVAALGALPSLRAALAALVPLAQTGGLSGRWWASRWFAAVALGIGAAIVAISDVPVETFAVVAALLGLAGAVVAWQSGPEPDEPDELEAEDAPETLPEESRT